MKFRSLLLLVLILFLVTGSVTAAADGLDIPEGIQDIEEEAFKGCRSLTGTLSLPDGIVRIGRSSFEGCTGFTGIPIIPESVQSIGARAFAECTGLSGTLYLPESIELDDTAFEDCPDLNVLRGNAPQMQVALIVDGPVDEGDMNEDCYHAVVSFCRDRGYGLPVIGTGDGAVDMAVDSGCNVILMPGFSQAELLQQGAEKYPDVKFIGIDFSRNAVLDNMFLATYREDQAGFMAGYAAVKLGYRHLGFIGGMAIPGVMRYGYGFLQGADTAAEELGVTDAVSVEFSYANSFIPDDALTEAMKDWYSQGVELVFSCGGGIWSSAAEAAQQFDGAMVIGADVDQASAIGEDRTLTSAVKSMGAAVLYALDSIYDGSWSEIGGSELSMGVISTVPEENFVQLASSTRFGPGFARSDYESLTASIFDGSYTVSSAVDAVPDTAIQVNMRTVTQNKIAIITLSAEQSYDEWNAAQMLQQEYGAETVQLAYIPDDFADNPEETSSIIAGFADDPSVRAIIINQAVPGTAEGFRRVKQSRSDILCLAGESHENLYDISGTADLAVSNDFISRGYLLVHTAHELGCDTFVHISFPRHMSYDTMKRRAAIMREACAEFGMDFVMETAPDPVSEVGIEGAQAYVYEKVPEWIGKYGTNAAFFCTNDGHTEPLIRQLLTYGGYFIEADLPSPSLGYPGALGIDVGDSGYDGILAEVETAVCEQGGAGRFGTWASSYAYSLTTGLFQHAQNVIEGRSELKSVSDLAAAFSVYSPETDWNGACFTDAGTGEKLDNVILVYQDTYIMGNPGYYVGSTSVAVPEKYYRIAE